MMNNPNKKNSVKKGGIAEEIDKLKQRREDRKNKGFDDNKKEGGKADNGKICDSEYETLIRKKKIQFNQEPENVLIKI